MGQKMGRQHEPTTRQHDGPAPASARPAPAFCAPGRGTALGNPPWRPPPRHFHTTPRRHSTRQRDNTATRRHADATGRGHAGRTTYTRARPRRDAPTGPTASHQPSGAPMTGPLFPPPSPAPLPNPRARHQKRRTCHHNLVIRNDAHEARGDEACGRERRREERGAFTRHTAAAASSSRSGVCLCSRGVHVTACLCHVRRPLVCRIGRHAQGEPPTHKDIYERDETNPSGTMGRSSITMGGSSRSRYVVSRGHVWMGCPHHHE